MPRVISDIFYPSDSGTPRGSYRLARPNIGRCNECYGLLDSAQPVLEGLKDAPVMEGAVAPMRRISAESGSLLLNCKVEVAR